MTKHRLTILLIGTLPPPVGGAGVSLKQLAEGLSRRDDVRLLLVNTGGVRGHLLRGPFRFLRILFQIIASARHADVISLQPVPTGLPIIGPFVWLAKTLWGKPWMIRMFGGQDYLAVPGLRGALVRWLVRRADLYLAQTKALVDSARRDGLPRVEWFPTHRPMPVAEAGDHRAPKPCRRFVFLSHVKPAKGIRELVKAAEQLAGEASVDVYGPFMDGLNESYFAGKQRVRYRGEVRPGEADQVLREYDALVFPTYWEGEGYPGIILEAFGAGLPVITTRWMSIPELVDETCGLLIEPRDADALRSAMQAMMNDAVLYRNLREGVFARRALFSAEHWTQQFVDWCRSLVATRADDTSGLRGV